MNLKRKVREQTFCKCGCLAIGILRRKDYSYTLKCDKCKTEHKYKNKITYQNEIYNILVSEKTKPIKLMVVCIICKESMYHNYKYQFCVKCRAVRYIYK